MMAVTIGIHMGVIAAAFILGIGVMIVAVLIRLSTAMMIAAVLNHPGFQIIRKRVIEWTIMEDGTMTAVKIARKKNAIAAAYRGLRIN
jgi:hypothetical protein